MKGTEPPSIWIKAFFWFILASYSVVFAEVLSGSSILPFLDPWGYLTLLPLYGLHAVLLLTLVVRWGNRSFESLFSAGLLFGLYEAYVTKVLFEPPWGRSGLVLLDVDWFWVGALVLWWHMFFAFIIPVLLAKAALTRETGISCFLPSWTWKLLSRRGPVKWALWAFVLWAGTFMGGQVDPATGVLAVMINMAVIYGITRLWNTRTGNRYTLEQLLPDRREFMFLFAFLVIWVYLLMGSLFGAERLPGIVGQGTMLLLYVLSLLILVLNLRREARSHLDRRKREALPKLETRSFLLLAAAMGAAVFLSALSGLGRVVVALSLVAGIAIGLAGLAMAVVAPMKSALTGE